MKILHVSHNKLPDGRVEKMAVLDKLLGHKTYFAGPGYESFALERVFDGCYYLPQNMWSWMSLPYFYDRYRSRAKKIIERVNPDIIHVHNILSARAVADSGYPFVLGDHEFYSMEWRIDKARQVSWMQKLLSPYQLLLWTKREATLAKLAPVVSVSEPIADYYRRLGAKAFVIPNYPSQYELERATFSRRVKNFTTVYLGSTLNTNCSYRNDVGFVEFFKSIDKPLICLGRSIYKSSHGVHFSGFIPHMQLYTEMSKCHVGVIPWRKHAYHRFCCPNKAYSYAHSGLVVIITPYFREVIKDFMGRCRTMEKYEDLEWILQELQDDMDSTITEGEENMRFARENFIFENYKDVLKEAYRSV